MENKNEFDNANVNETDERMTAQEPQNAHYVPFDSSSLGNYSVDGNGTYPPQGNPYTPPQNNTYVPFTEWQGGVQPSFAGGANFDPVEFEQKRNIKKLGNGIGLPLSIFIIASSVIGTIVSFVLLFALGMERFSVLINNPNFQYIFSGVLSIVLFTLPFLITGKFIKVKLSELVALHRPKCNATLPIVMLGLGACALGNIATSIFAMILNMFFGIVPQSSMPEYGTGYDSFALMLLCVGVLPALVEEFAFRGVVLGALRRYFGDGAAILISATLFGLIHGNLQQIPFAFCVGIVLGYATVYTGSLVPAMIIHALNNSLSVVLSFASRDLTPGVNSIVSYMYLLVLLLLGLCGSIILMKTDNKAFALEKKQEQYSKKYFGWFSTSAWMIVFVVLCVLTVISVQFPELLSLG